MNLPQANRSTNVCKAGDARRGFLGAVLRVPHAGVASVGLFNRCYLQTPRGDRHEVFDCEMHSSLCADVKHDAFRFRARRLRAQFLSVKVSSHALYH
jgi:hypothetical protein